MFLDRVKACDFFLCQRCILIMFDKRASEINKCSDLGLHYIIFMSNYVTFHKAFRSHILY